MQHYCMIRNRRNVPAGAKEAYNGGTAHMGSAALLFKVLIILDQPDSCLLSFPNFASSSRRQKVDAPENAFPLWRSMS